MPDPRYFSIPSILDGAEVLRNCALKGWIPVGGRIVS